MAEQQGLTAPFPTPPPFYKYFTKQNLTRLEEHIPDGKKRSEIDVLALPAELRYLLPPPPPPADGKLNAFGVEIDLNAPDPSLEHSGIEQLYPSGDAVRLNPQPQLIALARSLLTTFLSLTGILANNPEQYEDRVADLQAIMFNMHNLINQYRPHQARESLILMMEERVEKMRTENQAIEDSKAKVARLLSGLRESELAHGVVDQIRESPSETASLESKKQRARQLVQWEALDDDAD